ncbi:MAG: adenylate/guanylate cyclase domain-containing protein [Alphaproteobacteria bacterium]
MTDVVRKLTTILVTDAVGFSEMMGRDEPGTLARLKRYAEIIKSTIGEHRGRLFGTAGDSFIAEFSSPLQAVLCANVFQRQIARVNEDEAPDHRMWFRVGINLGDVMTDDDNLYGEGVNVAARLEQIGEPGGICVSRKVYDEVRRNLGLPFVDGGVQQLKNIADPVPVYHVRPSLDGLDGGSAPRLSLPSKSEGRRVAPERQMVTVRPLTASGDSDATFLVGGLREGITDSLARHTAIAVLSGDAGPGIKADFVLDGTVRTHNGQARLSFSLTETASGRQVWNERFDRRLDAGFDLEDEVARAVASVVRIRLKALAFEALRETDDALLPVPDLLSKAAGYFVRAPGKNDVVEPILRRAIALAPENSMAHAMLVFCHYRRAEHRPHALPDPAADEMRALAAEAVRLDARSYFARLMAALVAQELDGDWETALAEAETALELNPAFTQATAMRAVAACHLGRIGDGVEQLAHAVEANKEDPHRFRHLRELALAHLIAGDTAAAVRAAARLLQLAPDLARNRLVHAGLLAVGGDIAGARTALDRLRATHGPLPRAGIRPTRFADAALADRFGDALRAAGLADE